MATQFTYETITTGKNLVDLYLASARLETRSGEEMLDILSLGEQVIGRVARVQEIRPTNLANRQEHSHPITRFNSVSRSARRDADVLGIELDLLRHDGKSYVESNGMFSTNTTSFQGRIAEADANTEFLVLKPLFLNNPLATLQGDRWWTRVCDPETQEPLVTIVLL